MTELLGHGVASQGPGIVDALDVDPGYEAALGAALGDDLEAPENSAAAIHWTALGPLDESLALPGKVTPLAKYVRGPAALARRLAQVGVVEKGGAALQGKLGPGQRLVGKDGAMWRWDGFTVKAGAPTAAASRLKQRNRLSELEKELAAADKARSAAEDKFDSLRNICQAAAQTAAEARHSAELTSQHLDAARDRASELTREAVAENARLSTLGEAAERLSSELAETARLTEETRDTLDAAAPLEQGRARRPLLLDVGAVDEGAVGGVLVVRLLEQSVVVVRRRVHGNHAVDPRGGPCVGAVQAVDDLRARRDLHVGHLEQGALRPIRRLGKLDPKILEVGGRPGLVRGAGGDQQGGEKRRSEAQGRISDASR